MTSIEAFKILGPLSVLVTWASIVYILKSVPRNVSRSVSHHAALEGKLYRRFAVGMSVGVVLMWLFMTLWLGPAFSQPPIFYVIASLAVALELVTTWVPLTTGRKFFIHQLCSYAAAALIPAVMLILAISTTGTTRYICLAATGYMTLLLGLFLFVKKTHQHYLWYQTSDVLAFHLALLAVAYL